MCGRYTQTIDLKKLVDTFKVEAHGITEVPPRFNVSPTQPVLAVYQEKKRKIDLFHWGLIPTWAKDPSIGNRMINARKETITEKPSFRGPFKNSRCLVVADGFYEWKREGKCKIPYYIRLKSKAPFGFAGLRSHWTGKDGSEILSCTIITGEPNSLMEPIHHRMPMIMLEQDWDAWLDPANFDPKKSLPLLAPYPADEMEAYPVSRFVNSPTNDTEKCLQPATT